MTKGIKGVLNNRFLKNTSWMVFAQIYQMFISLIIGVISARYLGPTNYGTISYAASYISFFTIICALGLEGVVVKEMVSDRKSEGKILGSSIVLRLFAGVLSMISVCLIIKMLNPNDTTLLTVAFLQSIALVFNAFNIIDAWYQSNLKSKIATLIRCTSYTIVSIYKVVLLVFGKSVMWFAFSTSLDAIIIAVLFLIAYRKQSNYKLKFENKTMRKLIKQSYHLVIAYLMAVIYSQMDKLMIGMIIDQTHVGYYTAAATICNMWVFIPQALSNSARPIIMELKEKDEDKYLLRLRQLNCVIFWVGIIFALGISVVSGFVVNILYGTAYMEARYPLMILVWSTVFSSLSYPRSIWMLCENRQSYTKKILLWGVVINLILNVVLVPFFDIKGAAIATFVTEAVTCFLAPCIYKETRIFVKYLVESISIRNIKDAVNQFKN